MSQLIRLHWDFFGPDAPTTAEHFLKHLDQFCSRENVTGYRHWVSVQPIRSTAVMECDEQYLKILMHFDRSAENVCWRSEVPLRCTRRLPSIFKDEARGRCRSKKWPP
jgi:hypothetical protein